MWRWLKPSYTCYLQDVLSFLLIYRQNVHLVLCYFLTPHWFMDTFPRIQSPYSLKILFWNNFNFDRNIFRIRELPYIFIHTPVFNILSPPLLLSPFSPYSLLLFLFLSPHSPSFLPPFLLPLFLFVCLPTRLLFLSHLRIECRHYTSLSFILHYASPKDMGLLFDNHITAFKFRTFHSNIMFFSKQSSLFPFCQFFHLEQFFSL